MSQPREGIFAALTARGVFLRIVGHASFRNGQPVRSFGLERMEQGFKEFYVDLDRCRGMDSTFLGVLAGIASRLQRETDGGLRVFNADARNREQLQALGLDRMIRIEERAPEAAPSREVDFFALPDSGPALQTKALDEAETSALVLEAHEELCRADERNQPKFREVVRLLRESIERDAGELRSGR